MEGVTCWKIGFGGLRGSGLFDCAREGQRKERRKENNAQEARIAISFQTTRCRKPNSQLTLTDFVTMVGQASLGRQFPH